jgi:flavin reductase (DIM6/NTAB) family NADH-FMN oxidoreductase RutF
MACVPEPSRPPAADAFDASSLRRALGLFPTGVVVATTMDPEVGPLGMTLNSFVSVSLDPPLVSFSIGRSAASLPAWRRAPGYALNVLARGQERLSNQFARAHSDKWRDVAFARGLHDAPLLHDTVACFECSRHETLDGGDHVIFLARVQRLTGSNEREPLVFHGGRYAALERRGELDRVEAAPLWPLSIHY